MKVELEGLRHDSFALSEKDERPYQGCDFEGALHEMVDVKAFKAEVVTAREDVGASREIKIKAKPTKKVDDGGDLHTKDKPTRPTCRFCGEGHYGGDCPQVGGNGLWHGD